MQLAARQRGTVQRIGMLMVMAGLVSAALSFLQYELQILFWIDLWGPTVGWAIRFGLVTGGMLLLTTDMRRSAPAAAGTVPESGAPPQPPIGR